MSDTTPVTPEWIREVLGDVEDEIHSGVELAALVVQLANAGPMDKLAVAGLQRLAIEMEERAERVREAWRQVMDAKSGD